MSLVRPSLDLLYANCTLLAILAIEYSIIKMKMVPNIFWILNMLGTVLIILRYLTYPYFTDVKTEKDKDIFSMVNIS